MVGKLLKHELRALFRVLWVLAAVVLLFAAIGRILLAVEMKTAGAEPLDLVYLLVTLFYSFAILALIIAAWVLGISRFYKSLFTGEGYMTLSLPVSSTQLLVSKLLSSLIAMVFAAAVSVLSLFLFFVGKDTGFVGLVSDMFGEIVNMMKDAAVQSPLLFAEQILLWIVSVPLSLLLIYSVISIGQLFTNHRTLIIILIGFGLYIAVSVLEALASPPIQTLFEGTGEWGTHLEMWLGILWVTAIDVLCFLFVRYILKNKVNLIA